MADINSGLTYAADEHSRAPEAPLDPETAQHVEQIRVQSQAARETPSGEADFNKDAIREALLAPRGVEAGIVTADEAEREEIEAAYSRWEQSDEGQRSRARIDADKADLELGRAARRMADVVSPAFEVLAFGDAESRAGALVQLSLSERELAVEQGVLHPSEIDELVALGAELLDARMRVQAQTNAALAEMEAGEDRLARWQSIRADLNIADDRDAEAVLAYAVQRVAEDSDGRMTLGTLPAPAWEAAVRASIAQLQDTQRAHEVRNWKQAILDEDRGDVASGLTEGGVPSRPRDVIAPRFRPAEATAKALARGRVETDDEVRASVAFGHEPTSVALNVREGGNAVPESVQAKMRSVFGGH